MRLSLPLALILCLASAIEPFSSLEAAPEPSSEIETTVSQRYYPIRRASLMQMLGLVERPYNLPPQNAGPIDPFAANPNQQFVGPCQVVTFEERLKAFGFDFPDGTIAFDGEQLIVSATDQQHLELTKLLSEFETAQQVRLTYWIERRNLNKGPLIGPKISALIRTGKRMSLKSPDGSFSIVATPNINEDGSISIISEPSFNLQNRGPSLEVSSEVQLLPGAQAELASVRLEQGRLSQEAPTPKSREEYRLMMQVERIAANGTVRPFHDSLIQRLRMSDQFNYEIATFPLPYSKRVRLPGWNEKEPAGDSLLQFFEDQGISFHNTNETGIDYNPDTESLTVRQTPEALNTIRNLLESVERPSSVQMHWNVYATAADHKHPTYSKLGISLRSLSGKRVKLTFDQNSGSDDGATRISVGATANIERDETVSTIQEIQIVEMGGFHEFTGSTEIASKDTDTSEWFHFSNPTDNRSLAISSAAQAVGRFGENQADDIYQAYRGRNLETRFYPVTAGSAIRLTGFCSHLPHGSPTSSQCLADPFAHKTDKTDSAVPEEISQIQRSLECAGIDFSNTPGSKLAFDGEQLIVTQTPEAHDRISTFLRRGYANSLNERLHLELTDKQDRALGQVSSATLSGKRVSCSLYLTEQEKPDLQWATTPMHEHDGTHDHILELKTSEQLFPEILPVELALEFITFGSTPNEIATLPTQTGNPVRLTAYSEHTETPQPTMQP